MPLTIRSALTPILGRFANGMVGHLVDVLGVVATILGVSVTIGFGVSQFVDGVYAISGMEWLMNIVDDKPKPSTVGLLAALFVIMGMSIISAVSGVGRGIKYLSNLNLVLSLILLLTFVFFGSFLFAMTKYGTAMVDYIIHFISLSFGAYGPQSMEAFKAAMPEVAKGLPAEDITAIYNAGTNAWGSLAAFTKAMPASVTALANADEVTTALYAAGNQGRQFGWQSGWTTFYWAWWIAFSPFVGLFLARISKGRSIREFVLGCVIAPALVCFAWMTILGATAIDLELSGVANGAIIGASTTAKLFATLGQMMSGGLLSGITVMCVVSDHDLPGDVGGLRHPGHEHHHVGRLAGNRHQAPDHLGRYPYPGDRRPDHRRKYRRRCRSLRSAQERDDHRRSAVYDRHGADVRFARKGAVP